MKNNKEKVLVVGSGLTGTTVARVLAENGLLVDMHEARSHFGGNIYDYRNSHGILIHKYGPHAFHTESQKVWEFINKFGEWVKYEHKVRAFVQGFFIPLPFNFSGIDTFFGKNAEILKEQLLNLANSKSEIPFSKLNDRRSSSKELSELGNFLLENIYSGYSFKQWGKTISELGPEIINRVPIRANYDDRYFSDKYQYLPLHGYTVLVEKMLSHPNIKLHLNSNVTLKDLMDSKYKFVVFTGSLDKLFDFKYGQLEYRSLEFRHKQSSNNIPFFFTAQTNFPNHFDFTRICDYTKFYEYSEPGAHFVEEFPKAFKLGENEPFYPIGDETNRKLHQKYIEEIEKNDLPIFVAGRLGQYRYFNMDQAIASGLSLASSIISTNSHLIGSTLEE